MPQSVGPVAEFSKIKMGLRPHLAELVSRNPDWQGEIDSLRAAASEVHPRCAGAVRIADLEAWDDVLAAERSGWSPDRPRRWSEEKLERSDPERGNFHVQRHAERCRTLAWRFFYDRQLAGRIHRLVLCDGYLLEVPPDDEEIPVGPLASSGLAFPAGASWASSHAARRESWYAFRRRFLGSPESFRFEREV